MPPTQGTSPVAYRLLAQRDELIPQLDHRFGWGPARYSKLPHTGAIVGFIGMMTTPDACDGCNELRLTADGKIRPCLGDHSELDLHPALLDSDSDAAIREVFQAALRCKPQSHSFLGQYQPSRPMNAIGG